MENAPPPPGNLGVEKVGKVWYNRFISACQGKNTAGVLYANTKQEILKNE